MVERQWHGGVRARQSTFLYPWLLMFVLMSSVLASCGLNPPPAGPPVWPTPVPPPPAYPTMEPKRWLGGSDPHATFQLPGVTVERRAAT